MGSKASKPAQTATRKFPTRTPGTAPPQRATGPSTPPRPQAKASVAKDEAIRADSMDPDSNPLTNAAFSQRLRQMGIATPNPTLSNSSIASTGLPGSSPLGPSYPATLSALEARQRLQEQAEAELENMTSGRGLVDAGTLRQALMLRERGTPVSEIERRLRLRSGLVAKLGPPGVTSPLT